MQKNNIIGYNKSVNIDSESYNYWIDSAKALAIKDRAWLTTELTNLYILYKQTMTDEVVCILKDSNNDSGYNYGHIVSQRSLEDIRKTETEILYKMQIITNAILVKNGIDDATISILSNPLPSGLVTNANLDYIESNMSTKPFGQIVWDLVWRIAFGRTNEVASKIWQKLILQRKIPRYGYCNAIWAINNIDTYLPLTCDPTIRQKILTIIKRYLSDKGLTVPNVCDVLIALKLCWYITDDRGILEIARTEFGIDIKKSNFSRRFSKKIKTFFDTYRYVNAQTAIQYVDKSDTFFEIYIDLRSLTMDASPYKTSSQSHL